MEITFKKDKYFYIKRIAALVLVILVGISVYSIIINGEIAFDYILGSNSKGGVVGENSLILLGICILLFPLGIGAYTIRMLQKRKLKEYMRVFLAGKVFAFLIQLFILTGNLFTIVLAKDFGIPNTIGFLLIFFTISGFAYVYFLQNVIVALKKAGDIPSAISKVTFRTVKNILYVFLPVGVITSSLYLLQVHPEVFLIYFYAGVLGSFLSLTGLYFMLHLSNRLLNVKSE